MLRRLVSLLWYLGASLVVMAALLLSLARLTLPLLEAREDELGELVKQAVGQDAHIGELALHWRGLGPELRVRELALQDPGSGQVLLTAQELRVGIDLFRSLWNWRPVPSRLVLIGSEVRLYRDADGHVKVEGISLSAPATNPWLLVLSQPHVEVRDIRVHWHDELGRIPALVLTDVDLRLRNRGERHQLQAYMQLPAEYGRELQLAADLRGGAEHPEAWQGRLYLDIAGAPLARWTDGQLPNGLELAGMLDGRFWADVRASRIRSVSGEVAIDQPRVGDVNELFAGRQLVASVAWRDALQGWTLHVDRLRLTQADRVWPETGMTLVWVDDAEGMHQVQLAVDYLRIESVAPWLAHILKATPEHQQFLGDLQPGGEIRGLQFGFKTRHGRVDELVYKLDFADLYNTAVGRLPGSRGLSGRLSGDQEQGTLVLDSRNARLVFPTLFRESLQLDQLRGDFGWRRIADRWRVETGNLTAENADIATLSRLRLDLPTDGSKPLLDLQTSFRRGRVQDAYKYLPAGIMPPRTVAWLDRALVSGEVRTGAMLFHGRLGQFPFDNADGRMEVRATVTNAILDYMEGWHRIEGLEAELTFINRAMHIRGTAGKVLGSELRDVDVRIDDLPHARLEIDGHAKGELADMLRFVRESPLGGGPADALGSVQALGGADLHLQLTLPLAEHKPAQVKGTVAFTDNGLGLPDWDLMFEGLKGELQFTEAGVRVRDMQGLLMGAPVRLNVDSIQRNRKPVTRVRAVGALPLVERLHAAGGDFWKRVSGASDWTGSLYLPLYGKDAARPELELESGLRGIAVDLPAPLGKAADEIRPFLLRTTVGADGIDALTVILDKHSAALGFSRTDGALRIARGEVRLGSVDARLPKAGLRMQGALDSLSWDAWRNLMAANQTQPGALAGLEDVALQVGRLQAYDRTFNAVDLRLQRDGGRLQADLHGPDIQGKVELPPADGAPLKATLEHLRIPAAADGARGSVDPAALPPLDIDVQRLWFHDLDLGRVTLRTRRLSDGLAVDSMEVGADWMKFGATGQWTRHAEQQASRFRIELKGGDLGRLLSTFGYAGSLEGGETYGEIDANWPGSPADFALEKLEGTLALRVGPGRIVNLETGAGRMFGLFSLQGLRRRLALDFSDVFEKGFSFDRIEGHFTLLDSDAYTNDLMIEGPAARIEISGRTGLARHDYDQLVSVFPQVQSTLPIAGALAGGPVVGAALLLADKLFAKQMEDLTSFAHYQYTVTGSWENPQFQKVEKESAEAGQSGKDKRRVTPQRKPEQ